MSTDSHGSTSLAYASAYEYGDSAQQAPSHRTSNQAQPHYNFPYAQGSNTTNMPSSLTRSGGSVGSSGSQQYSTTQQWYPDRSNHHQPVRAYTSGHPNAIPQAPIYQQSNMSMPALDPAGRAGNSKSPPLADDLGQSLANIKLLDTPSFGPQRYTTRSPFGMMKGVASTTSVRASAVNANQEIQQSAAEVHPDHSLAAIAHELDQTAAGLDPSNGSTHANQNTRASQQYDPNPQPPDWDPASHTAYNGQYASGMRHHSAPAEAFPAGGPYPAASVDGHGQQQAGWDSSSAYYPAAPGTNPNFPPGPFGGFQPHSAHQPNGYSFVQQPPFNPPSFEPNPYFAAASGYLGFPDGAAPAFPPPPPGVMAPPAEMYGGMNMAMPPSRSVILSRQPTQMSVASGGASSSRRKSKEPATNQNTLPFNKSFVNEYRQRMKGDPDPEAQFAYAKYLIEAAKKVHDPADGPKQQRKYRDQLLSESLKLIKRLATTGMGLGKPPYAEAQFFLANCFGNGSLGLQVDHEKAYNLYIQASKQNHPAATYRTAVCNEVGAGTRRDFHRAVLFYRKASALGDTAGMYKLGMILLSGMLGQPRNVREAIVWLKRAGAQADEDNPHALHELGLLHEKPNNGVVVHDEPYARELFTQAAQLGYAPSQFKLGTAYEYGSLTCPVDPKRSIAWYTKAACKGDGESELALSGWYLTGSEGVLKQSDSEAYLWARRAATKGIPKAEYAVGYYSEVGIGVKSDIEEAKRWYMRAAVQGNKRAVQRLTELKKMKGQAGKKGARPTRKDAESECVIA